MALVIEDGSIVQDAQSYVTVAEAQAYASARGETLPADSAEAEALLLKAMDYLEAKRDRYQGYKVAASQPLQWPRVAVVIDGYFVDPGTIPEDLKKAQMQLAIEAATADLMPTDDGQQVLRQKADVLEVQYAERHGPVTPTFPKVEALLASLYKLNGASLTGLRV